MHGVTKRRAFTCTDLTISHRGETHRRVPSAKGDRMLRLKRIADVMKTSADTIEDLYRKNNGVPSAETAKLIKELRELAKEILTSQEFLNSKIKL
jgi:hypothetical protein